jgi:pimeloyl-ACP methyl ester carboxylesterase
LLLSLHHSASEPGHPDSSYARRSQSRLRLDRERPDCLFHHVRSFFRSSPTPIHYLHLTPRNGPSEFHVIGSLRDWSIVDELHTISVPTLLINGRYDEATDTVVQPFFDRVPKVKWVSFAESSHLPQWEERERYMEVVAGYLKA